MTPRPTASFIRAAMPALGTALLAAALLPALAPRAASAAGTILPSGRMWSNHADFGPGAVVIYDLGSDLLISSFNPGLNGRGVAYDPRDGNIWLTWVENDFNSPQFFLGDGFIHKYPPFGGGEVLRIPEPGGPRGLGIGALDFDGEEGVLWAASYIADPLGDNTLYKFDPDTGAVLFACDIPTVGITGGGIDSLTIACLDSLGGQKVLLSDLGETLDVLFVIDPLTCAILNNYPLPARVMGIDYDFDSRELVVADDLDRILNLGVEPFATIRSQIGQSVSLAEDISLEVLALAATCDAGGPYLADCLDGTASFLLDGSASSAGAGCSAGTLSYEWTSDCPGAAFDDPTLVRPTLTVSGPPPCPLSCTATLTIRTAGGFEASCERTVEVRDVTAPVVSTSTSDLACLWPPNHAYVCFGTADLPLAGGDECSGATLRFAGCVSDQPDEAPDPLWPGWNGDGHFRNDCIVSPDGLQLCARAERCGTGPTAQAGRRYGILATATDDCGNVSAPAPVGYLYVPHDQSPSRKDCLRPAAPGRR